MRFVAGGVVLFGISLVLLAPAYLVLLRFRWARLLWPISISILAVWLPPVIGAIDGRAGRQYLAGYDSLALGFTLVLVALFQAPWQRRLRREFGPVAPAA